MGACSGPGLRVAQINFILKLFTFVLKTISRLLLNISSLSSCKRLKKVKIGRAGMMKSVLGQPDLKMSENGSPLGFYLFITLQELLCCALKSDL